MCLITPYLTPTRPCMLKGETCKCICCLNSVAPGLKKDNVSLKLAKSFAPDFPEFSQRAEGESLFI